MSAFSCCLVGRAGATWQEASPPWTCAVGFELKRARELPGDPGERRRSSGLAPRVSRHCWSAEQAGWRGARGPLADTG